MTNKQKATPMSSFFNFVEQPPHLSNLFMEDFMRIVDFVDAYETELKAA